MKYVLTCMILLGITVTLAATDFNQIPPRMPAKYLAGYSWYDLGSNRVDKMTENYFIPMQRAGFNNIDLKMFQNRPGNRIDLSRPEIFAELKRLVQAANDHNLLFTAYVFTEPFHGHRSIKEYPRHAELTAFVDENGMTVDNLFCIIDYDVMRELYNNAYELATASTKIPIGAVKFDIENVFNSGVSYDDHSWNRFCKENPSFNAAVPADKRLAILKAAGAEQKYKDWFILQFEKLVRRIADELHAINPKLSLGVMPAIDGWGGIAFAKNLATAQAPAFMDDWSMYDGNGYDRDFVQKRQAEFKALNPHNLYIPWLRLNSHQALDLPSQLYACITETDGYNVWAMHMVDPTFTEPGYELPNGNTYGEYYTAFGLANHAWRTNKPIEYKKLKATAQPLDLKIKIPELKPFGNGTGPTPGFVLRDQQTAYIYAEAGEPICAEITHLSGAAKRVAIQYVVLDRNGNKLRHEVVLPGDEKHENSEKIAVTAPYTGVYALTLSGGIGGLAWYRLAIYNKHYAFEVQPRCSEDARGIYLFYQAGSFDVYFLRNGLTGSASIVGGKRAGMVFDYRFGIGPKTTVAEPVYTIDLPGEQVVKMTFSRPEHLKQTQYMQDFIFYTKGAVVPYIYDNPERALVPKE